ncbi:MarR family winged helix-turn-helix transcriptional regulator [Gymnodinialimonas sp. 2305UL16-5]|uniref:MarR family winged helix-turn-helix transcriptional regulator n=1 Tax=Gymnodinialimonas mytili TaxID=3126503 RepID=UPI0030A556C1
MTEPIQTPQDMICFALYSAQHAMGRLYRPLLEPLGLTYPQYIVLLALGDGAAVTLRALRTDLGLETNTLTPLLKRMEANGLLKRKRNAEDERGLLVTLTEKGKDLRAQAMTTQGCILEATGLSETDLTALQRQITTLRKQLENAGNAQPA